MNEQIQRLYAQAFTDEQGEQFDPEKFAHMIVAQSIDVVKKRYMGDLNREDQEVLRCVEDLKRHWSID